MDPRIAVGTSLGPLDCSDDGKDHGGDAQREEERGPHKHEHERNAPQGVKGEGDLEVQGLLGMVGDWG